MDMKKVASLVKQAAIRLAAADASVKNGALRQIAGALERHKEKIIAANREDLARSKEENLAPPLLKRLVFDEEKIETVINGINDLIELEDPVGKTLLATELDVGLELYRVTCPIGVIGVIFESRPDALVQIAALCLKSGNGVLLKGGSEARETNRILSEIIITAAEEAGIPQNWACLLETRDDVRDMLKMDDYIDLIIPRGSNEFVRYIMEHSNIPVLGHADGICHCYVDAAADLAMAEKIVVDSKTQYVSVCNALETLLIHEKVAPEFLPRLQDSLEEKNVEIVGCPKVQEIIAVPRAEEEDWRTEYLDYKVAVKVVASLEEAVDHINTYGSGHTDAIVTENKEAAAYFMNYVDSGNVFWNCSTRFSDGFRYGFGAEVGIGTGKIHARGPVGLDGLVIYKYKLIGNGQIVADYAARPYLHRKLDKGFQV